jgi:C-terminal processing protease CtpA/Prc
MRLLTAVLLLIIVALPVSAQMTTDQRVFDFQNLAALFEKRYAPADWKLQALGFDMFNLKPWLDRVRAAKDDLEFFEIEGEYVANLQDTHTGFQITSTFTARLGATTIPLPSLNTYGIFIGMTVDVYDGKVLIDSISRTALPTATYPFQVGDELVSVDGVSANDWITRLSTWRQYGNPATTRRFAASEIVSRSQTVFPRAVDTPDQSTIAVRRASGVIETYTIRWLKTGYPVRVVGPVPSPGVGAAATDAASPQPSYLQTLEALRNYKLADNDPLYAITLGSRFPHFRAGFPSSFVQRLGNAITDFHYSGSYTSGGLKIGYLRIPSFAPPNITQALSELKTEIDYFQKNTDGLVVDVTRNPGGGCYMLDAAAALTPYPFYFFGQQLRATQTQLYQFQSALDSATFSGADPSIIATFQLYLDKLKAAYYANRGLTDPIPACSPSGTTAPPISQNNSPAATVYTKPLIILIDELSISAADIFPAMMQDNHRGLIVGMRSSGGGGSVSGWYTGMYSESYSTNTDTLVVRKNPITTPEYPTALYVENIGTRPDVALDFMTRDNLLSGGVAYVNQFTQTLLQQISNPVTPFAVPNKGAVSLVTGGNSQTTTSGYARITANNPISGFAIVGYRPNNVLVSEAAIPATTLIQAGRIFAEINGSVDTGVAIANPNNLSATLSFFFTGPSGDFGSGTTTIPANGQISGFLDQAPFNGSSLAAGTFSFTSNLPVAAVALRGFTNERQEFIMTPLPVVDLSATLVPGANPVSPQFIDGGAWTTQIQLVNATDATLQGSVVFYNQSGTTISTVTYSIPARSAQKVGPSPSSQTPQSGYVVIQPSGGGAPPSAISIFSFKSNGVTVSEAGFPALNSGTAYRLYAETSGNFGTAAAGSVQTGIAVANSSNTPVTITLDLLRMDGSTAGLQGTLVVAASGQAAKYLNEIQGLTNLPVPFQGIVRITSSAAVTILGLRQRYNERGDLLMTPLPAVNDALPAANESFVPNFDDGGGFNTQFIIFNGPSTQASGTVRLLSPSGSGLNVSLH